MCRINLSLPTIRQRLVILVVVAFTPVMVWLLADAYLSRNGKIAAAEKTVRKEVELAVSAQNKQVLAMAEFLIGVASLYADPDPNSGACATQFHRLLGKLHNIANIGLLNAQGKLICSALPGQEGADFSHRPYFQEARDSGRFAVSKVIIGSLSKQRVIIFAYPRHDRNGKFSGVVFASYSDLPHRLSTHGGITSRFSYFDHSGEYILSDPDNRDAMHASDLSQHEMELVRQAPHSLASYSAPGEDGKTYISALSPITGPSGTVAYVRAAIAQENVLKAWQSETLLRSLSIAITLLCGLMLVAWLLKRWLVQDLVQIIAFTHTASSEQIQNWPVHAKTAEAQDAMQSVVQMAMVLQEQREQLSVLHTEAHAMNVELASEQAALSAAKIRLEKLSAALVNAQEQERKHLARELHDEFGQRLTALYLQLHSIQSLVHDTYGRKTLQAAVADVTSLIKQVRELSVSLRPPSLDFFHLDEALTQLIDRQLGSSGIDCTLEVAGLPAWLPETIEITAYRLVQEGLTNVLKHADATRVIVEINGGEDGKELEVILRDNGRGFDVECLSAKMASNLSRGILGMRERVELLGGTFAIASSPGCGTRITANLPIKNVKHEKTYDFAG